MAWNRRDKQSPGALADEDLMDLARGNDSAAFAVLYDRHSAAAFSLAYRMCGTRPQAEDVVQDAFLAVWRSAARYDRTRASVRTWVLGIVHNRAIDSLRRGQVHDRRRTATEEPTPGEWIDSGERIDEKAASRDEARIVREALDQLPDDQGKVVQLAYFGGFSHSEIAEILGQPLGTVKGRMRLALVKLRDQLSEVQR